MNRNSCNLTPAIVLGCHKMGLGVIRALGEMRVPVVGVYYNRMDMGYVSKYVIARYHCPHPDHDEKGFVSFLIDLASEWKGSVLMPSDDPTLVPTSRHKDALGRFYKVAANDWDVIEKAIFKKYTYALADEIGVPSPRTTIAKEFKDAVSFVKEIGLPCVLKPTVGHLFFEIFRKKMIIIENLKGLEDAFREVEKADMEMMIQEFVPGNDRSGVNYNSFFVRGEQKIEVTAEKVRLTPPFIGFPRVVISKLIPEVLVPGRTILKAMGYDGFSCMEFKRHPKNGIYYLMEINARLNLSTPLSVKSGINFPYLTYKYYLNGEAPEIDDKFTEGIYWIDIGKDIAETIRSYRTENITMKDYLKPYLSPHVFTILSYSDPMPCLKRSLDMVKAIPRYISGRGIK